MRVIGLALLLAVTLAPLAAEAQQDQVVSAMAGI
jgi:hypothetical protein